MEYRCVATSVTGFVQQLASCYLPHGYWFYVSGFVPAGKDPRVVDAKLLAKYGIGISRQSRARRKAAGVANVHYLRYERRFLLLATHGHHPFFDEEAKSIRDARRAPIQFAGYSISVQPGGYLKKGSPESPPVRDGRYRVRVQIARRHYQEWKAYLLDLAGRRSSALLAAEFYSLPFEPYAPVRQQLLNLLRLVNAARRAAGRDTLPPSVLRLRRRIVRPFEPADGELGHGDPPSGDRPQRTDDPTPGNGRRPDRHASAPAPGGIGPDDTLATRCRQANRTGNGHLSGVSVGDLADVDTRLPRLSEEFLEWALTYMRRRIE